MISLPLLFPLVKVIQCVKIKYHFHISSKEIFTRLPSFIGRLLSVNRFAIAGFDKIRSVSSDFFEDAKIFLIFFKTFSLSISVISLISSIFSAWMIIIAKIIKKAEQYFELDVIIQHGADSCSACFCVHNAI